MFICTLFLFYFVLHLFYLLVWLIWLLKMESCYIIQSVFEHTAWLKADLTFATYFSSVNSGICLLMFVLNGDYDTGRQVVFVPKCFFSCDPFRLFIKHYLESRVWLSPLVLKLSEVHWRVDNLPHFCCCSQGFVWHFPHHCFPKYLYIIL